MEVDQIARETPMIGVPRVRRRTVATRAAAFLLLGSLGLTACGGGDHSDSHSSGAEAQNVAAGSELDSTWPLTGLPVTGDDTAAQDHPVLVLKMDNTYASQPQLGLSKADMVVEELVEGGLTRLAAFFYSQIPGTVGPVRSMRASDIGVVSPVKASVVTSGAAQVTLNRIKAAGITWYTEGDKGFFRDSSRSAPYNLFTDLKQTATLATTKQPARPADYLPWGSESDFAGGVKAKTIAATFSGGHTTNWTYADGHYVNENTYAAQGDEFPADSVLVLRVKVGDAGYTDPAGNPVPETKFTGTGQAMLFHDGQLVRGKWSKSSLSSPVQLSTTAGKLTVPAGHTWIELVPQDGGSVTFTKK
jgi:hypothetical protein